jgi:hypothetical protein
MCDNEGMDKQKIAELVLALVVLSFGVLIASNYAYIDEGNSTSFTSAMFSRRQVAAPLLRIVDETKEGTYSKSVGSYPQFVRGPIELNTAIKDAVDQALQQQEDNAATTWNTRMSALAPMASGIPATPTTGDKLPVSIRWEPAELSSLRLSFLLRIIAVTGGVHDTEEVRTFNYDLHAHRLLTLPDVFPADANYLDQLSGFSYDSLKQQLTARFNTKLSDAALKWLKAGTAPQPNNYKEFTIDHGFLTIYFGQYQVAAYEHGIPEVTYPLK